MLYGAKNNQDNELNFRQRVADQNIQSLEDRQEDIRHAKNGFIGMLAGILVGGIVGWIFLGPADSGDKEKEIPVIRRPITMAKVQPNDPGGMEIDNQNREIYHIVDNQSKAIEEVNIIPAPEMPKLISENNIKTPENIENLVESIEETTIPEDKPVIENNEKEQIKLANKELSAIKTNSNDKIIIPEKLKDVDVKLQKTINSGKDTPKGEVINLTKEIKETSTATAPKPAKGTWYAQIIASSSRQAVNNLWNNLSSKHSFLKSYIHEIEEIKAANGSTLYRLKVGAFKTRQEAETLSNKLKQNQISSIIKQN